MTNFRRSLLQSQAVDLAELLGEDHPNLFAEPKFGPCGGLIKKPVLYRNLMRSGLEIRLRTDLELLLKWVRDELETVDS